MEALKQRWHYLFHSTKGLALVNIALISLVTAFFGMLSGPMQEFGISAWIIKTFNLVMVEAEREGRIAVVVEPTGKLDQAGRRLNRMMRGALEKFADGEAFASMKAGEARSKSWFTATNSVSGIP